MEIRYGPITEWPRSKPLKKQSERIRAPFKTGFDATFNSLAYELQRAGAKHPVVQLAISPSQFTREGRPYMQAKAEHPGVILSFLKTIAAPGGGEREIPLNFPCDTYVNWESNLRAIVIVLEDLRRIDRYGVSQNAEQYQGFKALPPPGPNHDDVVSVEQAAEFIGTLIEWAPYQILKDRQHYRNAYHNAARKLHPDSGEGEHDEDKWNKLQAAKAMLDRHHRV